MIIRGTFINARDSYIEERRSKRFMSSEDINQIVEIVQAGKEVNEFSVYVKNDAIVDGNLLPSRYVMSSEMNIPDTESESSFRCFESFGNNPT